VGIVAVRIVTVISVEDQRIRRTVSSVRTKSVRNGFDLGAFDLMIGRFIARTRVVTPCHYCFEGVGSDDTTNSGTALLDLKSMDAHDGLQKPQAH
jgi:hypothetical protein